MFYCEEPACPYHTELATSDTKYFLPIRTAKRSYVSVEAADDKTFNCVADNDEKKYDTETEKDIELYKIHRFQELFKGRYTEREAQSIIDNKNGDIDEAVNFVFEADPREIREVIGNNDEWKTVGVKRDNILKDLALRNEITVSIRQYGCMPCDEMWWKRVPARKEVSKCRRCHTKYDAIPRDKEWGWAKFDCQYCGHVFHGFGQVGTTQSPCYNCGAMCMPCEVIPPMKHVSRRSRRTHSCSAPNCFNRSQGGVPGPRMCVHPMSLRKKVVYPSNQHRSTGSTVVTFLTQDDLQTFGGYEAPSMADIGEENGSDDEGRAADGGV